MRDVAEIFSCIFSIYWFLKIYESQCLYVFLVFSFQMGLTQVQIHMYFFRNLKCIKSWNLHLFSVFFFRNYKMHLCVLLLFLFFFFSLFGNYNTFACVCVCVYICLFLLFGDRNASLDFSFLFFPKFGNWKVIIGTSNISWKFQNYNVYVSKKCIIIRYTTLYHTENRF